MDKFKRLFTQVTPDAVRPPAQPKPNAPVSTPPLTEAAVAAAPRTAEEAPRKRRAVDLSLITPDWFGKIDVMRAIEWSSSVMAESGTQVAEEIRSLRTNLWTIRLERDIKSIAITSCRHNEGKTTMAINLSLFMAKNRDRRILLIDADLRRPKLKSLGNLKPDLGFDDLLQGRCEPWEVIRYSERDNLYFMPTVRGHSNASELLELPRTSKIIAELRGMFDYIIYDAPPILSTTDPVILGRMVDGVIMAVKANATQRESVEHAQSMLEQVKINIVGVVLTQMRNYIPRYLYRYQYYHDYYHYYYTKTKR